MDSKKEDKLEFIGSFFCGNIIANLSKKFLGILKISYYRKNSSKLFLMLFHDNYDTQPDLTVTGLMQFSFPGVTGGHGITFILL